MGLCNMGTNPTNFGRCLTEQQKINTMATPTYVSAGSVVRGVASAQTGINISSNRERFENPKEYILDRFGGRTGLTTDYDKSSATTIEGETSTALNVVAAVSFATAITVANEQDGYGITTGDYFLDDIEVSQSREAFTTATINLTRVSGLTAA